MQEKSINQGLTTVIGFHDHASHHARLWNDFKEVDHNRILDGLMAKMRLKNDAALASKLQVIQPIIRMLREGSLTMAPPMFLGWIQEATGIDADELKELAHSHPSV